MAVALYVVYQDPALPASLCSPDLSFQETTVLLLPLKTNEDVSLASNHKMQLALFVAPI